MIDCGKCGRRPLDGQLKRGMKSRHLMMLSIGGTIGTGLFVGAGQTIAQAGPLGAVIAYVAGGMVMFLVLLCLAEMAVYSPVSGSFQTYASRYISPTIGFVTGWLYWLNWAIAAAAAFTAAGIIAHNLLPQVAVWQWCGLFGLLIAGLNLISVRAYGETEFWFAGIKVVAIIVFVLSSFAFAVGWIGNEGAIGVGNLRSAGSLFPNGGVAVFLTIISVIYSFQGAELVGIAAGECEDPTRTMPRVIKGLGVRIILFYVLTMVALALTVPFAEAGVLDNPFAQVFARVGLPAAALIMNLVILTSALSANNGALYACSRLLWAMAGEGMAPQIFRRLNRSGVPYAGLFFTLVTSMFCLLTEEYAADSVYLWLMAATSLLGTLVWMIIAWSQLNFRRLLRRRGEEEKLLFRTPWFPVIPVVSLLANAAVVASLWVDESQHVVLYSGAAMLVILLAAARLTADSWRPAEN
ncbi:MAG: amino acid permease [Negativicutes bacterium]|nr:amino acid permease [Negativicutes bacterium]